MGFRTRSSRAATTTRRISLAFIGLLVCANVGMTVEVRAGAGSRSFYIVKFQDRISDAARGAVVRIGLDIVDYEPDDAYLVWGSVAEASAAAELDVVESALRLPLSRKVHPSLRRPAGMVLVEVTAASAGLEATRAFLSQLSDELRVVARRSDGLTTGAVAAVPAQAIPILARRPEVLYVQPASRRLYAEDERTTQIVAGNIDESGPASDGYLKWLRKVGLNGFGTRVSIVDTGISEHHADISSRISRSYSYTYVPDHAEENDIDAHGTHVAGIIGGFPHSNEYEDEAGFLYGVGVAPEVRFVRQQAISSYPGPMSWPPDRGFETISRDAWAAGARMWNASWHTGEGNRAGYLASARQMDEIARNAVANLEGPQEFLLVFSAGNSGTRGPTVPKEAKNIIAVGSTASGRGALPTQTSDIDEVSSFSSRGPTKDKRIFPTVVAPGENVISARAPEGVSALPCTDPVVDQFYYCSFSGTSMAAPHVTGSAALIHQWWQRRFDVLPSPPMVKALLVNSATDIGERDIPNNDEGWGRIDLGELFSKREHVYVDQERVFHGRGQYQRYVVAVPEGSRSLRVTVAWADAPAAVGADKVLVNDLDLVVELLDRRGEEVLRRWRGNVFKKGLSVTGGKPDRLNNLENVYLSRPIAGRYRITVVAENLPGDGIPENADETDQDFALVVRS